MGSPVMSDDTTTFTAATSLSTNEWTLSGSWQIDPEYITSESSTSKLTFDVYSKNVYVVAGSANNEPESVAVGLPNNVAGQYGSDVSDGSVTISGSRLYHIVSLHNAGETTVTLTVPAGVSIYTFTFGS